MSSSTTDMLATAARPLVYGSQGGISPATMEQLTIERGGAVRYFAACPWPRSRPYDEVGRYRGQMEAAVRAILHAARPSGRGPARHASGDAGLEYVDVFAADGGWSAEWRAQDVPDGLEDLIARLRAAIDEVRAHPICVARASLHGRDGVVVLRLENRGGEPFPYEAFGPDAEASAVHVLPRAEGGSKPRSADDAPVRLAAAERIGIVAPGGSIEPGDTVEIPLDLPARGNGLECLVRLRFRTANLAGENYVEDGWIWPHALTIGDA